jgi:hypothetical protein
LEDQKLLEGGCSEKSNRFMKGTLNCVNNKLTICEPECFWKHQMHYGRKFLSTICDKYNNLSSWIIPECILCIFCVCFVMKFWIKLLF